MSVPPTGVRHSLLRGKSWFWGPVAPLLALDLWSKAAVFAHVAGADPMHSEDRREQAVGSLGPIHFDLVSWRNQGTIWGLGNRGTIPGTDWITAGGLPWTAALIGLRFVAVLLIVYFAWRLTARQRGQQLVLGMILAGAIGNLYDNLTQIGGGVRDFLRFSAHLGNDVWTFPAFNVADSCICVGAFALAFQLWRQPDAAADPESAARVADSAER